MHCLLRRMNNGINKLATHMTTCLFGWGLFTDRPLSHPAGLKQVAINGVPVQLQAPPIRRLLKAWRHVHPALHSSSFSLLLLCMYFLDFFCVFRYLSACLHDAGMHDEFDWVLGPDHVQLVCIGQISVNLMQYSALVAVLTARSAFANFATHSAPGCRLRRLPL